jgi:hypothetical protein
MYMYVCVGTVSYKFGPTDPLVVTQYVYTPSSRYLGTAVPRTNKPCGAEDSTDGGRYVGAWS